MSEPGQVRDSVDPPALVLLRDGYRRAQLQQIAPDTTEEKAPKGNWPQLVGAAHDRSLYGFFLETTPEDDDRLIQHLNSQDNRRRFNLLSRNCADFARSIINFYYPGAIRRSIIADLGITTPKHAAKSLVSYAQKRPELKLAQFVIPQLPGTRRSGRARGVTESVVRSKKYVVPLAVLQPWVAAGVAAAYVASGRFNPSRLAHSVCEPDALADCVPASEGFAVPGG